MFLYSQCGIIEIVKLNYLKKTLLAVIKTNDGILQHLIAKPEIFGKRKQHWYTMQINFLVLF